MHAENADDIEYDKYEISAKNVKQFNKAREIPDTVVHTENVEHRDGRYDKVWHRIHVAMKIVMWDILKTQIEAKIKSEKICKHEYCNISNHQ